MFRAPWQEEELAALAARWREAAPFPHLVIEGFVPADGDALMALLDDEGLERYVGDLYAFDATAPVAATPGFAALAADFAAALAPGLAIVTGKAVTRVDLRAYVYREGDHLLPHTDHQDGLERLLAYAYYLPSPEPPVSGELELYACSVDGDGDGDGELAGISSARVIEARPHRLAIFDVSAVSLHQVREVMAGLRISLAGWFYA